MMSHVELTEQMIDSMRARDPDEPVAMINLLKFRDITQPEADISSISGRDCYFNHYAAGVSPVADRLGTCLLYTSDAADE